MITRNIYNTKYKEKTVHNGKGFILTCRPMNNSLFSGPWNFVDYAILKPGTSIGLHQHSNNEELYFILEGKGIMTVNGEQRCVTRGDLILNPPYGTHGLKNDFNSDLHLLVIEVGIQNTYENSYNRR